MKHISKICLVLFIEFLAKCSAQINNNQPTYYFCSRNISKCPNLLDPSDINVKLPTKILIHGFTENYISQWCTDIVNAYLKKDDYNLILVDWSKNAKLPYIQAVRSSRIIGSAIGNFLINTKSINLKNVHIIGHSLGSHVAGVAGKTIYKETKKKVSRITGLDPAGPLFEVPLKSPTLRLTLEDAEFVDVIHTDGGLFGFRASLGHADFFPNGGTSLQPGCIIYNFIDIRELFCSHRRSHQLFLDSINSKIMAKLCSSWEDFKSGACNNSAKALFGDGANPKLLGNFYLITRSKPPYSVK